MLTRWWSSWSGRMRGEAGLTLTEMMVTISLLALVIVPALMFLVSAQRNQRTVDDAVRQQQDARVALEAFSRAVREGSYPQGYSYTESSIFVAASTYDVTFYSDVDNDGTSEQVRYWLDTSTHQLMETVTKPDCSEDPCTYQTANGATAATTTVVSYVRNDDLTACSRTGSQPLLSYSTVSGGIPTPVPTPGGVADALVDINYVQMTLVTDVTPGKSPTCQTLSTTASLRNWRA